MISVLSIINYLIDRVVSIAEWIDLHSDFVTAAATAAIAFFTWTLWRATKRLWKVSLQQSKDMKISLAIAQESADAAKKSADALPAIERAYLFVKVTMKTPDAEGIAGTVDDTPQYNVDNVKVIVTNRGKTAALLTGIPYTTKVFDSATLDEHLSEFTFNYDTAIPPGTAIIESKEERIWPADFFMNIKDWHAITMNEVDLTCLGCIHYEDVFGNPHKTVFCWKYEQYTGFHPDKDPKRNDRT